jgi:hypothetical protein
MSCSKKQVILWSVIGLLAGALAESAQAQIVINGAGSSAGRQFAGGVPIAMCLPTPRPVHLRSAANDTSSSRHTWICNVTHSVPSLGINFVNQPAVIRYSASESGDGYIKVNDDANANTATYILDTSSCGPAVTVTAPNGLVYDEHSNCTQQSVQPVHFGASDVQANSFGQTGPTGQSFPDPSTAGLQPAEQVAVLPFSLFVNNGVRLQNVNGSLGSVLDNLNRPQIEAIFRRNVRDWADLGYVVTSDGTTVDATKKGITLCLREAGGGTPAAFDQTQMIQSDVASAVNGAVNGTGGSVLYSPTSTGIVTCVQNNVNAIGYLNAESVVPNAHPITINGASANYAPPVPAGASAIWRKRDVACGRYDSWTTWVVTRRTDAEGTPVNNMIRAFADAAKNETNSVPSGTHWVALSEMKVTKSSDAGPISWIGGLNVPDNLDCRP